MSWRLARSLVTLRAEVRALHPGTTVWTIGDASHQQSWSDHNPNAAGVVCAADFLADGGLNLGVFAEHVRTSGHVAAKYVIYNRRIASRSQGWTWRSYSGSNPHTNHVHVSVGVGPDGRSTGPYDDTTPWGLSSSGGDDPMIGLKRGDQGEDVTALQVIVRNAGNDPGDIDGVYGPATAAAVLATRRDVGSSVSSGDEVTGWAYAQIMTALARAQGGGGEDGEDGRDGKDASPEQVADAVAQWMDQHRHELRGEPGKTPTKIAISGDVVEVA